MASGNINPEVTKTIADMDGERIAERSALDYPRHLWSSYKNGHYRFALAGVAIVAPIAAAMGAITAAIFFPASMLVATAAFTAIGSLLAAEGFGAIGAAAASRAAGLAEKHARILDADARGKGTLGATDDKLMYNGHGQHFEFPPERDKGKFFSWKSGIIGSLMGAASGAVIGLGAATTHLIPVTIAHLLPAAAFGPVGAAVVAGAITFGAFGLTFGVERNVVKSIFNQTDANVNGSLTFKEGPDLGRAQSKESDHELAQHRLRRQEEIGHLEREYNERISWGALSGRFKGFAGGIPGALIGAAIGALVVGAVVLTGGAAALPMVGALGHLGAAAALTGLFSCAGAMLGMEVFAQSGTEAGAEATARAIDNEFERNRALRAQGITPPKPKEPEGNWFSLKPTIYCGILGAAIGLAIAVAFGPGILAAAAGHELAAGAIISKTAVLASTLVGGMTGATYGIGIKGLKAMSKPFTSLYDKVVFGHNDPAPEQAPALAPAPATQTRITPEEVAALNEKLAGGNGKNFAQMTQQQAQPAAAGVGA